MKHNLDKILEKLLISNTKTIYHYTTTPALFNGILTEKDICLWATNVQYLNDPSEFFGFKIIQFLLEKDYSKENLQEFFKVTADNYFVTSFSKHSDYLPMWSMYGANGTGISLGFDREKIEKNSDSGIANCYYIKNEKILKTVFGVEKIDEIGNFFYPQTSNPSKIEVLSYFTRKILNLFIFIFLAKNQSYKYEKELRLITNLRVFRIEDCNTTEGITNLVTQLTKNPLDLKILEEETQKIKYRTKNNLIIPYIEHHFPKEALKEIIIGPTNQMDLSEQSIQTYLDHLGYGHVKIKRSEVPYRG